MNDLKTARRAVNKTKTMSAAAEKTNLASLKRPGDKGTIKKTSSGKFQPQLFIKELNTQRALGSCDTAEEAAEKLAEANDKLKRKEAVFTAPLKKQAKHGSVRRPCPPSALHISTRALTLTTLTKHAPQPQTHITKAATADPHIMHRDAQRSNIST